MTRLTVSLFSIALLALACGSGNSTSEDAPPSVSAEGSAAEAVAGEAAADEAEAAESADDDDEKSAKEQMQY